jgi:hypothetical protein
LNERIALHTKFKLETVTVIQLDHDDSIPVFGFEFKVLSLSSGTPLAILSRGGACIALANWRWGGGGGLEAFHWSVAPAGNGSWKTCFITVICPVNDYKMEFLASK